MCQTKVFDVLATIHCEKYYTYVCICIYIYIYIYIEKKVKGSRNRPGVAQRVPGGLGSQISMTFDM